MTLRVALALLVCAVAGFAIFLALFFVDQRLRLDLERGANARIERSVRSLELIVAHHLHELHAHGNDETCSFHTDAWVCDPGRRVQDPGAIARQLPARDEIGNGRVVVIDGLPVAVVPAPADSAPTQGDRPGRIAQALSRQMLRDWSELAGAEIALASARADEGLLVQPVPGTPFSVMTTLEAEDRALANARWGLQQAGLLAMLAALLLSLIASRWITAPIRGLRDAADRIGRGDFKVRIPESRRGELGSLARSLNDMAVRLERGSGDLQRQNAELVEARDRAEDANRAKSDFLANMSHEIRTPMTAILGYTDLLTQDDVAPGDAREWVLTIRRAGNHLLDLINSILDLSRIEAGKMVMEWRDCSLSELLLDVESTVRGAAEEKGLELQVDALPGAPHNIRTDVVRLRQILVNLVGNAIKFTEQGRISLRVEFDPSPPVPQLFFEVSDTGRGIADTEIERIFDPFWQCDASSTRQFGGTGLGLAISRRFARALGGDIVVTSRPGQGSVFRVTIRPFEPRGAVATPSPESRAVRRSDPERARVLVADDSGDNRRLIGALLRRAPLEIEFVEDGRQACERALAAQAEGRPFGLILMDMQMPVLDGYEATRELRDAGYELPIVALTAHAMSGDRERCVDAGCDAYATKPITRETLLGLVERWIGCDGERKHEDAPET